MVWFLKIQRIQGYEFGFNFRKGRKMSNNDNNNSSIDTDEKMNE